MRKRLLFPFFNGIVTGILGGAVGYYAINIGTGVVLGFFGGLAIGLVIEFLTGLGGVSSWLYKRRVLILVLIEIPVFTFYVGPYAYVLVDLRPPAGRDMSGHSPLDFGATTYEDVIVETEDGIRLAGWYVPPEANPGAVIILLHGSRGTRLATTWYATQFIEAGYGVLMYDQRALGESTGDTLSVGWLDWPDLVEMIDYLVEKPEVDPDKIGALGLSLGAYIALNTAYQDSRLGALWLDGIGAQRIEDFPAPENFGERFATEMNRQIYRMTEFKLGMSGPPAFSETIPALDQTPMTLIAAGLEEFERRTNEKYATIAGPNVEVWIIPNAYHCGGHAAVPDVYRQRMLDFFQMAFASESDEANSGM